MHAMDLPPEEPFRQIHAMDFWATDTRKVWGKSRMCATYIPDARNPSNHRAGGDASYDHACVRAHTP